MRTIMKVVTGMMELVVVTTLAHYIAHYVNAGIPMLETQLVDLQNMLMIDGVMMRTIIMGVTGMMGLVVVTMLTKNIAHFVNAVIPMLEHNFMKSMLIR